ncbi:MAG: 4-hydroxy-3-methylbut-2-enyl diphosphate reductase [Spirochaetes bacterium GWB1_36_13]|nr:MAG: 4-hydroxy-3-methylbut-2-enyl diphosphate reductase [Spirochaetes bacterium GWB1_36_13]
MKVLVPKYSGFCPGVKYAEDKIFAQKKEKPIFVYGHLIHNKNYIQYLKEKEIYTVEDLKEIAEGETVVVRTHGIEQNQEKEISEKYEILDLTCVKVKKLQSVIQSYSKKGYAVIITGKSDHPEVKGLKSYAEKYFVIEKEENIVNALSQINEKAEREGWKKILLVSQTTAEASLFEAACRNIKALFHDRMEIEIIQSICSITTLRENEALKLQAKVDVSFVIGDPMSSNSKKLFNLLQKNHPETYFIEDLQALLELKLDLKKFHQAQVVSSSSTPDFIEKEVIHYLESV